MQSILSGDQWGFLKSSLPYIISGFVLSVSMYCMVMADLILMVWLWLGKIILPYLTSRGIAIVTGAFCKLFPKTIDDIHGHGEAHYLNVNMAHEFWKDVKIGLVHRFDPPRAPWPVYFAWMIFL